MAQNQMDMLQQARINAAKAQQQQLTQDALTGEVKNLGGSLKDLKKTLDHANKFSDKTSKDSIKTAKDLQESIKHLDRSLSKSFKSFEDLVNKVTKSLPSDTKHNTKSDNKNELEVFAKSIDSFNRTQTNSNSQLSLLTSSIIKNNNLIVSSVNSTLNSVTKTNQSIVSNISSLVKNQVDSNNRFSLGVSKLFSTITSMINRPQIKSADKTIVGHVNLKIDHKKDDKQNILVNVDTPEIKTDNLESIFSSFITKSDKVLTDIKDIISTNIRKSISGKATVNITNNSNDYNDYNEHKIDNSIDTSRIESLFSNSLLDINKSLTDFTKNINEPKFISGKANVDISIPNINKDYSDKSLEIPKIEIPKIEIPKISFDTSNIESLFSKSILDVNKSISDFSDKLNVNKTLSGKIDISFPNPVSNDITKLVKVEVEQPKDKLSIQDAQIKEETDRLFNNKTLATQESMVDILKQIRDKKTDIKNNINLPSKKDVFEPKKIDPKKWSWLDTLMSLGFLGSMLGGILTGNFGPLARTAAKIGPKLLKALPIVGDLLTPFLKNVSKSSKALLETAGKLAKPLTKPITAIGSKVIAKPLSAMGSKLIKKPLQKQATKAVIGASKVLKKHAAKSAATVVRKVAGKAAGQAAAKSVSKSIGKATANTVAKIGGKQAAKAGAKLGAVGLKKIPLIGMLISIPFAIQKFNKGDAVGGLLELTSGGLSMIPGLGTIASLALDMFIIARDLKMSKNEVKTDNKKLNGFSKFFKNVSDTAMEIFNNVKNFFGGFMSGFKEKDDSGMTKGQVLFEKGKTILTKVGNIFSSIWTTATEAISGIVNIFNGGKEPDPKAAGESAFDFVFGAIDGVMNTVNFVLDLSTKVTGVFEGIVKPKEERSKTQNLILRNLPVIGTVLRFKDGIDAFKKGDIKTGLIEIGGAVSSIIPGGGFLFDLGVSLIDNVATFAIDGLMKPKEERSKTQNLILRNLPVIGTALRLKDAFDAFKNGNIVDGILEVGGAVRSLVPGGGLIFDVVSSIAKKAGEWVINSVGEGNSTKEKVQDIVLKNIPVIGTVLRLKDAFTKFNNKDYVGGLFEMGGAVRSLVPGGGLIFDVATSILKTATDWTIDKLTGGDITNATDTASNSVNSLFDNIIGGIKSWFGKLGEMFTNLPTTIGDLFTGAISSVGKSFNTITSKVTGLIGGVVSAVLAPFGIFGGMFKTMFEGLKNIGNAILNNKAVVAIAKALKFTLPSVPNIDTSSFANITSTATTPVSTGGGLGGSKGADAGLTINKVSGNVGDPQGDDEPVAINPSIPQQDWSLFSGSTGGGSNKYDITGGVPDKASPIKVEQASMINKLLEKMALAGITSKDAQGNILSMIHHESRFQPQNENLKYSAKRLLQVFPSKVKSSSQAEQLAEGGEVAIANAIYGGQYGNKKDEGYKYRGRGLIQLTFKDNYKRYAKRTKENIVDNPELLNDPDVSANVAIDYLKDRVKGGIKGMDDIGKVGKAVGPAAGPGGKFFGERVRTAANYIKALKDGTLGKITNGIIATNGGPGLDKKQLEDYKSAGASDGKKLPKGVIKNNNNVKLSGINDKVWHNFYGMAADYYNMQKRMGRKKPLALNITSGHRSFADQLRIWNSASAATKAAKGVANPFKSGAGIHGAGYALDVDTRNVDEMAIYDENGKKGGKSLMEKWGFRRYALSKPRNGESAATYNPAYPGKNKQEGWHIEPVGLSHTQRLNLIAENNARNTRDFMFASKKGGVGNQVGEPQTDSEQALTPMSISVSAPTSSVPTATVNQSLSSQGAVPVAKATADQSNQLPEIKHKAVQDVNVINIAEFATAIATAIAGSVGKQQQNSTTPVQSNTINSTNNGNKNITIRG